MNILYKLLHQDPNSRDGIIFTTSILGIAVNLLLAIIKIIIGLMTSSIAIISEGVNGLVDALSSSLTLIGSKLARMHPDEKHPFGYGRIEYLASLVISVMILVTGFEVLRDAIDLIFHPGELSISYLAIGIVAMSAVIKFLLGVYTIKMGKKANSSALTGVGLESRGDSFASIITIAASLIFLTCHVSLDAYAGILTSLLILKAGIEVLKDTLADLIGRPGEHELAMKIYREINKTEGIITAADLMLHNYGPDAYSGSVNIEIDHNVTIGEMYKYVHELQLRIMHEYNVTLVFGIYAVDNQNEESKVLRKRISSFVKAHEHLKSYHAVYIDEKDKMIYFDIIVDYKLKDWEELRKEFTDYITYYYPEYQLELTIETEFI